MKKLLIVDNDRILLKLMTKFLEKEGHLVKTAIAGLETYKRILEFHPEQRAVIASGFSETDHVKAAQKLGAGSYIKKPYTFEKIGLAVMEALY